MRVPAPGGSLCTHRLRSCQAAGLLPGRGASSMTNSQPRSSMKVFTRYIPLLALATLAATGCQVQGNAKYTGGGTMRSAGGAQNAVISFNGDTCSGNENAKGRVNFRDAS